MQPISRRSFVRNTSAGAGLLAVGAAVGFEVDRSHSESDKPVASAPVLPVKDPVVAFVRDAAAGQVELYIGTKAVTIVDKQLAHRLVRAATQ